MSLLSWAPSVTEWKEEECMQVTGVNKIVSLPSPEDVLPYFLRWGWWGGRRAVEVSNKGDH
jgi:hypothetical protein